MGASPCRAALLQAAFLTVFVICRDVVARGDRPNIVLVLTDDQDYMLNSTHPRYMPELDRLVRQRGLEVQHFITSYASCCPSRTSLLTGRHCHNTNMTSNAWPYGGYVKFKMEQLDSQYLPVWLQAAGYDTYYVGKFLNGFTTDSAAVLGCPRGWTDMDGLAQGDTGGGEELYYRDTPVFLRNCRLKGAGGAAGAGAGSSAGAGAGAGQLDVERWPDTFLEPVVRQKALDYIDTAAAKGKPFYLQVNTFAPHDSEGGSDALPEVEIKYRDLYQDVKLPKSANFGVQVPKQIGYWWPTDVREVLPSITARYRARLQALRSVDDTVSALVSRLACRGLLNRTVFIYTSDNGFKLGNHDITQEKFTQYEEDVRLPLMMAGPGIPTGAAMGPEFQAAMTDLTATVLWLAGASTGNTTIDGSALPLQDILARHAANTALDGAAGDVNTQFCAPAPPPDPPNPPAPPRPPPADSPPPKQPGMLQNLFSRPPGAGISNSGDDEETPEGKIPPASPRLRPPPPSPRTSPRPPLPHPPNLAPPPLLRPSPQPPQHGPAVAPPHVLSSSPPVPIASMVPPPTLQPTAASSPAPSPATTPPQSPRQHPPVNIGPSPRPPSPATPLLRPPSQPQPRPPQPQHMPPQPQPRQPPRPPPLRPRPPTFSPEQQQATPPDRSGARPPPLVGLVPPRSSRSAPKAQPPPRLRQGQRRLESSSSKHPDRGVGLQQSVAPGSARTNPDGRRADDLVPSLTHLLGGWRPEGWSWQHDLWVEEHAEGLGLGNWIRDINAAAAAASSAFNKSDDVLETADAARQRQEATMAALAGRPLRGLVDGSRLTWYSEERVRNALREAAAQTEARKQVALQAARGSGAATEDVVSGEQPAGGQRHMLLGTDAASSAAVAAAGTGGGPVPATRLELWSNVALIEAWLDGVFKGKFYKAIRACTTHQAFGGKSPWTCYKYTVLCNSVKKQTPVLTNIELYDLGQDPAEVRDRSRLPWAPATKKLIDRLDALLTVLAYCRGDTCRNPFSRVHPDGTVVDLATAMDPKYDNLYAGFQKLQYTQCGIYYNLKNENPDPFLAGRTEQRAL